MSRRGAVLAVAALAVLAWAAAPATAQCLLSPTPFPAANAVTIRTLEKAVSATLASLVRLGGCGRRLPLTPCLSPGAVT